MAGKLAAPIHTGTGENMSLSFKSFIDASKQKFLEMHGDTAFRDNLVRIAESYQDTKLTSTLLDTANATPVEVCPAPPTGYINVITGILTRVVPGATPFELGTGTLGFLLTDGSGASVATAVPNAQLESASTTHYWSVPAAVVPLLATKVVAKPSADVTAGDGAVYIRVFYYTVKVAEMV